MSRTTSIAPFVAGSALSARRLNQLVDALDSVRQVRGSANLSVTQTADGVSVAAPESAPPRAYPGVLVLISGPDASGGGMYTGRIATLDAIADGECLSMPQGMLVPAADDALVMNLPEDSTAGLGLWSGTWVNGIVVGVAGDGRRIVAADRMGVEWGTVVSVDACGNSVVLRPLQGAGDGSDDVACRIVVPTSVAVAKVNFSTGDTLAYLLMGLGQGVCLSAATGGVELACDGSSIVSSLAELNIINDHGGRADFSVSAGSGGCLPESTAALEWNGIDIAGAFTDGTCRAVRSIACDPDDALSAAVAAGDQVVPVLLRVNCPAPFTAGLRGQLPVKTLTVSGGVTSVTCDPASGTIAIVESLVTLQVPAGSAVDVGGGT